jgi:hypothetical protein
MLATLRKAVLPHQLATRTEATMAISELDPAFAERSCRIEASPRWITLVTAVGARLRRTFTPRSAADVDRIFTAEPKTDTIQPISDRDLALLAFDSSVATRGKPPWRGWARRIVSLMSGGARFCGLLVRVFRVGKRVLQRYLQNAPGNGPSSIQVLKLVFLVPDMTEFAAEGAI